MTAPNGWLLLATLLYPGVATAQSINKMEKAAINRTRITEVHGDSVEAFEITPRRPAAKSRRVYHWYAQNKINRSAGDYQGKLLHGTYRLLDRDQHLLASGD